MHGIDTGKVLGGRYALEELLARRDDTLDYWSAHDQTLDRLVAVTVLPATGEHEDMAHAVLDGARRTAGVDDPRLVRVLDVGLDDGVCWIVEEGLSEAISLASLVAERPLPAEEARRIVGEASSGLESARRRGLHHLYLNPHAVLRTREGSVKISGVGVASAIEQTDEISAVEASAIDTSDLLSLLYTGLTGRWPGEEIEALRPARRLADGTLPAPSEVVGGVPGDLDALCRAVFGAESDRTRSPNTPGELAKVLAPWPSEVVHGAQSSLDPPVGDGDGGAYAALAAGSGASAAATAAHPSHGDGADDTEVVEGSYYRTTSAESAPAGGQAPSHTSGDDRRGRHQDQRSQDRTGGHDQEQRSGASALSAGGLAAGTELAGDQQERPRQRYQSSVVLALIAAIVVVAMFLAYGAIQGLNPVGGDQAAGDGAEATGEQNEGDAAQGEDSPQQGQDDSAEETATPTTGSGDPIEPEGITSYDPGGDGDENNDLTDLAIDGDTSTSWNSRTYLADNWGNLKDGVGLAIDLGESQSVSEVDVDFPEGDYAMQVYVGDEANRSDSTRIGVVNDAADEVTVTADSPVEGRYVLIWFTEAWDGPSGEIVYVSEVTVR